MTSARETHPELPASPTRILIFSLVALAAGVAVARMVERSGHVVVPGELRAATWPLKSPADGLVAEILLPEGADIVAGTPVMQLAPLQDDGRVAELKDQRAELQELKTRQRAEADLELMWRTRQLGEEILSLQLRSAELLQVKYDNELKIAAYRDLFARQAMVIAGAGDFSLLPPLEADNPTLSRVDLLLRQEAAEHAVEVSETQISLCSQRLSALEETLSTLGDAVRRSTGLAATELALQRLDEELAKNRATAETPVLAGQRIGRVGSLLVRPGDEVRAGEPLAKLFDAAQTKIVLFVPSESAAGVAEEMELELLFPGDEKRTGRVARIAPTTSVRPTANEPVVEVEVVPAGKLWPEVAIGSRVTASLPR